MNKDKTIKMGENPPHIVKYLADSAISRMPYISEDNPDFWEIVHREIVNALIQYGKTLEAR